jgi:hypothetical protein
MDEGCVITTADHHGPIGSLDELVLLCVDPDREITEQVTVLANCIPTGHNFCGQHYSHRHSSATATAYTAATTEVISVATTPATHGPWYLLFCH